MQTPTPAPLTVDTTGAQIIENEASSSAQRDGRDIYLPNHVESVSHIAVDIGGSLAKVVYFTRAPASSQRSRKAKAGGQRGEREAPSTTRSHAAPPTSSADALPSARSYEKSSPAEIAAQPSAASGSGAGGEASDARSSPERPAAPPSSLPLGDGPHPTGTLTPSAIHSPLAVASAAAIRSTFLKRRSLPSALPGGRLNFTKFETDDIDSCISFLSELIESSAKANGVALSEMRSNVKLMLTGGGAHLFYEHFERLLGVEVHREDEMGCLITGLNFITLIPDEVFWYSDELVSSLHSPIPPPNARRDSSVQDVVSSGAAAAAADAASSGAPGEVAAAHAPDEEGATAASSSSSSSSSSAPLPRPSPDPPLYAPVYESNPSPKLPCLLVNIGSGVSVIKVDDYGRFERVSGTSLGGGTLWGLLSLLTDAQSFDEMLEMSSQGDNSSVDMLVSDIYGSVDALSHLGLKSSTIASTFGKVFRKGGPRDRQARRKKFRQEDICKSLLYAVSNNIGQIAYMNAEKFDLDRIYFGGCFIRGHKVTISTLSYAIRFWSKGTKRAFFLRHEGYLGAVGAWIRHVGEQQANNASSQAASQAATPLHAPASPVVRDVAEAGLHEAPTGVGAGAGAPSGVVGAAAGSQLLRDSAGGSATPPSPTLDGGTETARGSVAAASAALNESLRTPPQPTSSAVEVGGRRGGGRGGGGAPPPVNALLAEALAMTGAGVGVDVGVGTTNGGATAGSPHVDEATETDDAAAQLTPPARPRGAGGVDVGVGEGAVTPNGVVRGAGEETGELSRRRQVAADAAAAVGHAMPNGHGGGENGGHMHDDDEEGPRAVDIASLLGQLSAEERQLLGPLASAAGTGAAGGAQNGHGRGGDDDAAAPTAEELLGLPDLSRVDLTRQGEGEAYMAQLLAKLEQADVAADGLEAKLDALLGRLDGLLEEHGGGQGEEEGEGGGAGGSRTGERGGGGGGLAMAERLGSTTTRQPP